jgi:hypothetical protein
MKLFLFIDALYSKTRGSCEMGRVKILPLPNLALENHVPAIASQHDLTIALREACWETQWDSIGATGENCLLSGWRSRYVILAVPPLRYRSRLS